jgi:uncharacterized protein YjdB
MSRRSKWFTAFAGALALGCGLTAAGPTVDRIDAIDVSPPRFSLLPSQSAELRLTVTTSRGTDPSAAVVWSATGGYITSNQVVGNVRNITYQAPASAGSYLLIVTAATGAPADTADMLVTTTAVPVNAVTITPGNVALTVNDTTRLRATLTDSTGRVVVGRATDWTTSDGAVAQVLVTGAVRAIGVGTATITATSEGHSGTSVVTVTP